MEVILKEYVASLGKMGDVVNVSEGYGRNFLFPKGLAVPATKHNRSELRHQQTLLRAKAAKMAAGARALGDKLTGVHVTIFKTTGDSGRLYGSVTAMDIEDALHDKGFKDVHRRQILLDQPIKELGEYEVGVRIHPDVTATLKVTVASRSDS